MLICIDCGHGGKQPGAVGPTKLEEADVTLKVGLKLQKKLEAAGFHTCMTRVADLEIGINDRIRYCNAHKADLFVSLHCNAGGSGTAQGVEVWFHSGSERSKDLAQHLLDAILTGVKPKNRGIKGDGDNARFTNGIPVLRDTNPPAALIELDFIDNPIIEKSFRDENILSKYADAIVNGIKQYFRK